MKARWPFYLVMLLICQLWLGCVGNAPPAGDEGEDVLSNEPQNDGDGTSTGGTVDALSYQGSLSGSVASTSSTSAGQGAPSARLASGLAVASNSLVWLTDLDGNRLKDADGNDYADFPVNPDGTFDLAGVPVGVDMVLNIDVDGDGVADVQTIVSIPADEGGSAGDLDGVVVDPLSTLAYAKLVAMLKAANADPSALNLSFSALIERVRDAFENLADDSGIDASIELSEILALPPEQLAALFDELVPAGAQRGMRMFQGNIALAAAADVQGVVQAVVPILLEGGFVIADQPGGADLSFLQNDSNIRSITFAEYQQMHNPGGQQPPPPEGFVEPTLYLSRVAEPDRNFANAGESGAEPPRPIFSEHALTRMAEAYLGGSTITLRQLHRLLVDVHTGLGVRLTYPLFSGPESPPVDVFESPDGNGVQRNMQNLFAQINQLGLNVPDPQTFEQRQGQLRQLLAEFLGGTAEPSFDRLFGGILMERVGSADVVTRALRSRRAHLPFSRTGPARLFVVATADSFRDSGAGPVRVAVEVDAQGAVLKVRADPGGKFLVMFGPQTEQGMLAGLVKADNGRMLHDHQGKPQFVEIADGGIFEPVNGASFLEAFSEQGHNYPGSPEIVVPNWGFDPNRPEDPETNPRSFQLFVLMDRPGPDGVPVRVNHAGGVTTYDPEGGRYYVMFDPETVNGKFALVTSDGELLSAVPGDWNTRVLVAVADIAGMPPLESDFVHIFGVEVANPAYDPAGAPYYDDINDNGVEDAGEPSFSERHFLHDPNDWRSTFVEQFYRRASDGGFPSGPDIDWESETPRMRDGDPLVPRNIRARFNAFLFGRPSVAVNLLMAFNPPEFFDGTRALDADTPLNPFTVLALVNLVFDSVQNVEANVDWDGDGPMPLHEELVNAHYFVPPVGDPVELLVSGFRQIVTP